MSAGMDGAIVAAMFGRYLACVVAISAGAAACSPSSPSAGPLPANQVDSATNAELEELVDPAANVVGIVDTSHSRILEGTIGERRAGMNLWIRDGTRIGAGHFYHAPDFSDIPLEIAIRGEEILLREPGGGLFRLRLRGSYDNDLPPSGFDHAIGLQGTYLKHGQRVQVEFGFTQTVRQSSYGWYASVTDRPTAEFESLVRRFLDGVTSGNREQAAAAVSYPLRINGSCPRRIRNHAALLDQWDLIFTPERVAWLRDAIPHEMFVRQGMAMVANGDIWFDERGAAVINGADCPLTRGRRQAS